MSYTINGNRFSIHNMTALSSRGALNVPGRIGEVEYNWGDSYGTQAYVDADDLQWDGRKVVVTALYSGSNLASDMEAFATAYKGVDLTLVTTYGTHTVRLKETGVERMIRSNTIAIVNITFWEAVVTPSIPAPPSGGGGVSLDGYDFLADFNLHVRALSGFDRHDFNTRQISYNGIPVQYNGYYTRRRVYLELNGVYTSTAQLIANMEKLRDLLMSSGLKTLSYRGITKQVYFADALEINITKAKATEMVLNLRIQE